MIEAARSFRDKVHQSPELQDRIRIACTLNEDLDLAALGWEYGFEFSAREYMQVLFSLAHTAQLSDFDLEVFTQIKYYPDEGRFDWMDRQLREHSHLSHSLEVAVNDQALSVAVTTAPRTPPTLEPTLISLRAGGFPQTVHVFAEPDSLPNGWRFAGVQLHDNSARLGLYPNWLNAARWLLANTDSPYLMLCEDDVEFCGAAAAGLWHGLTSLQQIGYVSLYTPVRNVELVDVPIHPGWAILNLGRMTWGALAYAFPRPVLEEVVRHEDNPNPNSTDSFVAEHIRRMGLNCWYHLPSLARHTGDENSTVGHPGRPGYAAIGYAENYHGFRARREDMESQAM